MFLNSDYDQETYTCHLISIEPHMKKETKYQEVVNAKWVGNCQNWDFNLAVSDSRAYSFSNAGSY